MALPEVIISSNYSAGPPVNINWYTPNKGADWSGSNTDPALAAAQPGPLPYLNPIMSDARYYIVWSGNTGQASIVWRYISSGDRDDEYAAILAAIAAPVS